MSDRAVRQQAARLRFDGVIFDLDGTLADTLEDLAAAVDRMLAGEGLPAHDQDEYKQMIGHGIRNLVTEALPPDRRTEETIDRCLARMMADYGERCLVKTHLYDGIAALLSELRAGGVKLAVFSNKADELTRRIVAALTEPGTFDVVIGARADLPLKPDPAAALLISERLGVAPTRMAYLGDSGTDMITATAAGMVPVGVSWGFRSREEMTENGAAVVIDHPLELLALRVAAAPTSGGASMQTTTDAEPGAATAEPEAAVVEPEAARTRSRPRILLVCATRHGSTAEVAEAVAEELRGAGAEVDVRPAPQGGEPAAYDAVVIGGPMIMGWHRHALRYVARNRRQLASVPTVYFITAASLTDVGDDDVGGVPIVKDPWLVKAPRTAGKLRYKERYALPSHYLGDILKQAPDVRPLSVAFFAGHVDYAKMNIFEKLFVLLVIRAAPGDARNWEAIRAWARDLPALFSPAPPAP